MNNPAFKSLWKTVSVLLILILCVGFLGLGMLKLVSYPAAVAYFESHNYPGGLLYFVGVLEISSAVMVFYKPTRLYGMGLLGLHLLCISGLHIYWGETDMLLPPLVLLAAVLLLYFSDKNANE